MKKPPSKAGQVRTKKLIPKQAHPGEMGGSGSSFSESGEKLCKLLSHPFGVKEAKSKREKVTRQ